MVHASERTDSRIRMGLQRCESTGACMGSLAGLQDREEAHGNWRPPFLRARVSQAASEFHLVGQSQGYGWKKYLSGWISRARQYRSLRPQRPAADRWRY